MSVLKTLIKSALRHAGYDIFSVPNSKGQRSGQYCYSEIRPRATLSPWLADEDFMHVYRQIMNDTLLDAYRLHELWSLVEQTSKIKGDIVEVGVWRGGSGCLMASREKMLGSDHFVHLCDTFCGVVKAGSKDQGYRGGEHHNTSSKAVKNLADNLMLKNVRIYPGVFPEETGKNFSSARIRLLHIDVDVYESAKDSVEFLWDHIPAGGVIVFDDYGFVGCEGVTAYVDEIRNRRGARFIHNLNGHGIIIKY